MAETADVVRTFVGVAVPASHLLNDVLSQLDGMGRAIKTADAASLHVTVKFLGDTPVDRIDDIGIALAEIADQFAIHRIALRGVGVFPHEQRPSVVWVGMKHAETLVELAHRIEERMCDFGFEPEARAFSPHLTLARVKARPPERLFDLLKAHRDSDFGELVVNAVTFYRSELTPRGSVYTVLKDCPLGRDEV